MNFTKGGTEVPGWVRFVAVVALSFMVTAVVAVALFLLWRNGISLPAISWEEVVKAISLFVGGIFTAIIVMVWIIPDEMAKKIVLRTNTKWALAAFAAVPFVISLITLLAGYIPAVLDGLSRATFPGASVYAFPACFLSSIMLIPAGWAVVKWRRNHKKEEIS